MARRRNNTVYLAIVCCLTILSCLSCSRTKDTPDVSAKESKPAAESAEETSPKSRGLRVLFEAPKFELTDQQGDPFSSDELVGRVWIVNFIFTNCASTCPLQSARLAELQKRIANWP
ncbi:MAG: SCO family protein, partial [Aureliella sp.]